MSEMPEHRLEEVVARLDRVAAGLAGYSARLKLITWVLALDVVLSLLVGYVTWQDHRFRDCMTGWAAQFTGRTSDLSALGLARLERQHTRDQALTRVLTDFTSGAPQPRTLTDLRTLQAAAASYDSADSAYVEATRTTPVPHSPHCGGLF